MSVKVMARVWEQSQQKANKLLMLLAIADNANDDGWAFPGQPLLAKKCRIAKRGAQKLLDALEAADEVVIYNRIDEEHSELHYSNAYHLAKYGNPDAPPPKELRGLLHKRVLKGSEQPDATGVVNSRTLPGEQPDTTGVVNSDSLGSEQPDAGVVSGDSPEPSFNPSLNPVVVDEIDNNYWLMALVQLELQLDRASFEAWVRGTTLRAVERSEGAPVTFVVGTPSVHAQHMLENRYKRMVQRIVSDVSGAAVGCVRFELVETLAPAVDETPRQQPDEIPSMNGEAIQPDTHRRLFEQFIGAVTPANEAALASFEADCDLDAFAHALKLMDGKRAQGKVNDPLTYTQGIVRNRRIKAS